MKRTAKKKRGTTPKQKHLARLPITETGIDGERLQKARIKAGYSQPQFAMMIGYTYGNLSKVERGQMGCRTNVTRRMALVLGVSADYLMGLS